MSNYSRPSTVSMTIDKIRLKKTQYNIKNDILLQWNLEERKIISTETIQFHVSDMKKGIDKINELYILNGDIFKYITIHNE